MILTEKAQSSRATLFTMQQSGRVYDGYERCAVFLNMMQVQKRNGFQEILPNRQSTFLTKHQLNKNVHNVAGDVISLSLQSCEALMLRF